MTVPTQLSQRLQPLLETMYAPSAAKDCLEKLGTLLEAYAPRIPPQRKSGWDEQDVVLITYGDQIRRQGEAPLATLRHFLAETGLTEIVNTVHVLPFFPYSSDDGFSVIDFKQVDASLGSWTDIRALTQISFLMADLVLNHISRQSQWFTEYLAGRPPYAGFFHEIDPETDLSMVVRPRALPLLTEVVTDRGRRHVWTTFSDDQIDLNYANPDVLVAMTDALLTYLANGARIVRLDAIAYLWKEIGTCCIHLPQTHAAVKVFRAIMDTAAPGSLLLTETNVPHAENVSYFGDGNEAHMVYQFSLAPLLLDAMLTGDGTTLSNWIGSVCTSAPGTTFLNFTASHDGIGVRPLEGIVPPERVQQLADEIRRRGGQVSTKLNPDGSQSPYELNCTYFDALADPAGGPAERHAQRFLASQAIMLALRGVPAVYFHSLTATPNHCESVDETGRARSINRRKFHWDELQRMIGAPGSAQKLVFDRYRQMLRVRIAHPAFHPEAPQRVVPLGNKALVAFERTSLDGTEHVLAVTNLSSDPQALTLGARPSADLLTGSRYQAEATLSLQPYQAAWLRTASQ